MSDIFISYAREDRDKAESLARVFEQQQWSVWWDRETLPGSKYAEVIAQELSGAKAVIVLWSRASVASDWVKDEAQEGASRGILVPALVEKVSPPFGFRQVQTADLSDWGGSPAHAELQSLLRGISRLISRPVSAPAPPDDRSAPKRRLTLLYLLAGLALCLLLAFAGYFVLWRGGGGQPCSQEARHRAADLTGKGLLMIDPGGNYDAAVLQFNEATGECGDYSDAYFWRGQSYVALQKNDRALADFKKVLELNPDPDARRTVQKFIADLEGPRPIHTPASGNTATNANAANTSASNANVTVANTGAVNARNANRVNTGNSNTSNSNAGPANTDASRAQVGEIFAADKATRIAATTRLIIERKQDPAAVKQAIESALAHPDNKSGVINTLVYLENVDPAILKQNRAGVEKLLAVAKDNGPQTADHIKKVQSLLNS
jgi:tetratricopeptide (TPR) repeat protein